MDEVEAAELRLKTATRVAIASGVALVVGFVVGTFGAVDSNRKTETRTRQEAIDAGCAEWVVDQETGERGFEWRCDEKEQESDDGKST